ncbi:MAG: hypothetical protein KDB52_01245 [Solirubrobacterales bacterium]|nr:hypothetical protein [Solirubrobacterales bacterium]
MESTPGSHQESGEAGSYRLTATLVLLLVFVVATVVNLQYQPWENPVVTVANAAQLLSLLAMGLVARNLVILPVIFIPAILAGLLNAEPIVPGDMERAGDEMVAALFFYLPALLISILAGWLIHLASSRR